MSASDEVAGKVVLDMASYGFNEWKVGLSNSWPEHHSRRWAHPVSHLVGRLSHKTLYGYFGSRRAYDRRVKCYNLRRKEVNLYLYNRVWDPLAQCWNSEQWRKLPTKEESVWVLSEEVKNFRPPQSFISGGLETLPLATIST